MRKSQKREKLRESIKRTRNRPGAGRPMIPTRSEYEKVEKSRVLLRRNAEKAAQRLLDSLDAMKPLYLKDGDGFAPVEDVPDHAQRLRAAAEILDRIGVGKKLEVEGDPLSGLLAAMIAAAKDAAGTE